MSISFLLAFYRLFQYALYFSLYSQAAAAVPNDSSLTLGAKL